MATQEELKTMIKCFRVNDLQALLGYAGRSKSGRKFELQNRALSLLELKSQPLVLKIKQLYDSMQNGYVRKTVSYLATSELDKSPASTTERDDGGGWLDKGDDVAILDENECQTTPYSPKGQSSIDPKDEFPNSTLLPTSSVMLAVNSLCYPIHPDVKFKTLPFYEVLYELLRPSSLISQTYGNQQKNSFMFYMTPQQVSTVCVSRDSRQGGQDEFKVQGQLRFCLFETTSPQDDSFPAGLVVRINNKSCNIQESLLRRRKKKNFYGRDCAPPINITSLMKLNPAVGNKVEVQWDPEFGLVYVVGVYLVEKMTADDLLSRLKTDGIRPADYTRGMIKDKLNEEADSEILTTSLRVSLMCPLGKMRLRTPCRASTCQHLQCFDAALFIQMNERKPTWTCPVCDNPAEYDKLMIDGYFQEILSSEKLPPDVNEIELHSDGSWSSLLQKLEDSSGLETNAMVKVETEEVVEVLVEDQFPKMGSPECGGGDTRCESSAAEKRKVEEVDLTVSDSEDEPLIWYKRRGSSKNQQNDASQLNSDSNPSPPLVINIDSDSSDCLPLTVSSQYQVLSPLL